MCTYTDMQYTTYSTDSTCVWLVPVHFRTISKSHVLPELLFATLTEMSEVFLMEKRYLCLILLGFCNMLKWGGGDAGCEAIDSYLLVI